MQKSIGEVKKSYVIRGITVKVSRNLKKQRLKAKAKGITFKKVVIYSILFFTITIGSIELIRIYNGSSDLYSISKNDDYYKESLRIDNSTIELANNLKPSNVLGVSTNQNNNSNIDVLDKRAYVFDQYFLANNSPLYGLGSYFVQKCDEYGSPKDCITIVAIARNESNLCKYSSSAEMHNCWGFGGGGSYRIKFNSFEESIDRVSRVLMQGYGAQYMIDPTLMEGTFCGPQDECKNWGRSIKFFMRQIEQFSISLGVGSLIELRNT